MTGFTQFYWRCAAVVTAFAAVLTNCYDRTVGNDVFVYLGWVDPWTMDGNGAGTTEVGLTRPPFGGNIVAVSTSSNVVDESGHFADEEELPDKIRGYAELTTTADYAYVGLGCAYAPAP